MDEFPFQLIVTRTSSDKGQEALFCKGLFRIVPGRRAIYDATWNDKNVVAKVFSHKIHARRHVLKEWQGLIRLQQLGLNAPKPLFNGRTQDRQWVLVLEKIAESATILDIINETTDRQKQTDLLVRVYRELAKQHGKGVLQKDLHLGNFLLAGDSIYALDPGKMKFLRHQVPRKKSISQLALLLCCLPTTDTKTTKEVCREYFESRGWNFEKPDEVLLQKQMASYRKKGIRRALKKSLRTSGMHMKITCNRWSAVFDKSFCREVEATDFLGRLDALMDGGKILKDGNTCYVSHLSTGGKQVVVKRYNNKGFLHSLRHTIKRSRARRGWLHGHRLRLLNIATPKPLAYAERRKGLLIEKSYLVTEYVQGQRLYEFLRDDNVTGEQRSEIIKMIKTMLEMLAKYRITHGDLKHTNILITETGPVLTDLDGMTVHCSQLLYKNKRTKDIERFIRGTDISIV